MGHLAKSILAMALVAIFAPNAPAQSANQACAISRTVHACSGAACAQSVDDDFARYTQSELACGINASAQPYIERADPGVAPRGTVVLVHGMAANPALMRSMADQLRSQGYNVVAPILTGHGGSDALLARSSLDDWKADVHFAGNIATKMTPPTYIMGHSTGGTMAAIEAANNPGRYKAIVGFDPALNLHGWQGQFMGLSCIGQSFLKYASSLMHPIDSLTKAECQTQLHQQEISRRKDELMKVVDHYCSKDTTLPPVNYDFPLAAVCNLSKATDELTPERMKTLPPSLTIMSTEPQIYNLISKPELSSSLLQASPANRVVQSKAPDHKLMTTSCSPTFAQDMAKSTAWLDAHRTATAQAARWDFGSNAW